MSQPRGIIKVAFVDKCPLFGVSETTYPIFTGQIKTGLCRQETTICRCCNAHSDCTCKDLSFDIVASQSLETPAAPEPEPVSTPILVR